MKRAMGYTIVGLFNACLALAPTASAQDGSMNAETFKGLQLRGIGPAIMSGRIADIAIHPRKKSTWYVAVGSGGVWKTVNAGTSWTPLFDDQTSYSIGCITLDPGNPEVVWVGTGENVSGRHVGFGDGVYKSLDGGKTWQNMGLDESEHISKILIDPRDSNAVYVAAEGPLWNAGGQRGVFRSRDGGRTWTPALEIDEHTGVTDLEFDPRNPDIIYAAAYQRRRHVWAFMAGGAQSGIYKSTDAGDTWRRLKSGLPESDMGKIGLAVSPINPDIVYATIEAAEDKSGFYRSSDGGESWEKRSGYLSDGTGPHYYQEIYASPHKLDWVYQMDVWLHFSDDGGKNFQQLGEPDKHSDNHALAFDPDDPDYLMAGSDGGIYQTWDHGATWRFISNLPLTQFYKLALDNDSPFYNIVGGTQDNNTQVGPSRTLNVHGIRNDDWFMTVGGDGYDCAIDPKDPNIIYSEWQYGGLMRFDRRNGELIDIKPQPAPGDPPERWNWDSPVLISPHSHTRLYFGSQRLWRSDDRGDSWTSVSGDLSKGRNRYQMPFMDRVWSVDALYDNGAMSWYANLTTISESPLLEGLIYVGSDDGLVQVTENGGEDWRRIEAVPGVPEMSFVNKLLASVHSADTVFAAFDNHKVGDYKPYLLRSADRGRSWNSIGGDLPEGHLVWSLAQDHIDPDLLFAATEYGIFFTADGGGHWIKLSGGVPSIAFRDIEIQRRENDLVGASFGRGFYILDDYSALRGIDEATLDQEGTLFPVRDAWLYVQSYPLGLRGKANRGSDYFTAPNPPYGAVFTYHLAEDLQTAKERRRGQEKEVQKRGEDVPFPGWDSLKQEALSEKPQILLMVEDAQRGTIRRVEGPTAKGFHRVAWDLRFPPPTPVDISPPRQLSPWESPPQGPLAAPGEYRVRLVKLVDGKLTALGEGRSFRVTLLENHTLEPQDPEEVLAFAKRTADLVRQSTGLNSLVNQTADRLKHIRKAILDTPGADPQLLARTRQLSLDLAEIDEILSGDSTLGRYNEPQSPSLLDRVNSVANGHWDSTHGPTQTHRRTLEYAEAEFETVRERLRRLLETDLSSLEKDLEAAGAPWTPGRPVPER